MLLYTPFIVSQNWYCVVYTIGADSVKLYVNGDLKFSAFRPPLSIGTNTQDLFLGRKDNAQFPYWFNGIMDDIRIYNRAITQEEVTLLCSTVPPVPVKLKDFFTSVVDNKKIKLTWDTEEESGIKNYTIERSVASLNDFIPIGTVSPNGTSTKNNYTLLDNTAKFNTLYYYRLAITDYDGSKKYSDIKTGKINNKLFYASAYPNPATGIITVNINNSNSKAEILVRNELGQLVLSKKIPGAASNIASTLDLSNLSKGNYWITVQTDADKTTMKILLNSKK